MMGKLGVSEKVDGAPDGWPSGRVEGSAEDSIGWIA
jgi:hypothetical protein